MSGQNDLLSMLEGMESSLAELVVEAAPEAAREHDRPSDVAPRASPFDSPRLDADSLPVEQSRHPDPPARYQGVPSARERAAAAFASFRWGGEPGAGT